MTTNAAHDPVYKVTTTHYWAGCCSCSQSEVLLVEMKGTPVCVPWVTDMHASFAASPVEQPNTGYLGDGY